MGNPVALGLPERFSQLQLEQSEFGGELPRSGVLRQNHGRPADCIYRRSGFNESYLAGDLVGDYSGSSVERSSAAGNRTGEPHRLASYSRRRETDKSWASSSAARREVSATT